MSFLSYEDKMLYEGIRTCTKILRKIMTFQKLAKTHFGQCLVHFSK